MKVLEEKNTEEVNGCLEIECKLNNLNFKLCGCITFTQHFNAKLVLFLCRV